MRTQLWLEEFDAAKDEAVRAAAAEEELRAAAYEQGYTAGWDDAITARDAEDGALRQDLKRRLADLSFTYHEAHGHVVSALRPLLLDMVRKVLPTIARDTLAPMIADHLAPAAGSLAGTPMRVAVNPAVRDAVEAYLGSNLPFPVTVAGDESLADGEAQMMFDRQEVRLDLDGVVKAIALAVADFFHSEASEERLRA